MLAHEWLDVRLRDRHRFQDALRAAGLVDVLVRRLGAADPADRGRAALLLGHLRLAEAVPPLEPLLDDPDGDVRHAAVRAVGLVATDEAAWALVRALQRGSLPPERILEHVSERAIDALLAAYHIVEFAHVRAVLAEALGLAGDPRAGAALAGILPFGSEEERVRCCRALGRAIRTSRRHDNAHNNDSPAGDASARSTQRLIVARADAPPHARAEDVVFQRRGLGWTPRPDRP